MITSLDEPARRSRRSRSLRPSPYTSALSKKFTPRSSARNKAYFDSASSTSPQVPPIAEAHSRYVPPRPPQRTILHWRSLPGIVAEHMRVLFIGGTGIISSACTRRAVEQGVDLTLICRGKSARPVPKGVRVLHADIRQPASVLAAIGSERL